MTTRRSKKKAVRRSRKSKSSKSNGSSLMTVEGLQSIFEKIDARVRGMIDQGKNDKQLGQCVRKAWEDFFHRSLTNPVVQGMLKHFRTLYPTVKSKIQRGGMAPLSYNTAPGSTDMVYGRFPVEYGATPSVVNDLDRFFESPVGRSCDATGGFSAPSQAGGKRRYSRRNTKKQTGGGFFDSLLMPHAPHSVPRNVMEGSLSSLQGAPILNPPASPITHEARLNVFEPKPFDPQGISQMQTLSQVYAGY